MASTFSNLKFELIGTGDQSGTWGTTTNTNLGTAIEQALVGMATISSGFVANSLTLTLTDTNAAQNARALVLNLTQALSGAGTLNVPAIQKPYMIINATGQTVTVKVTGLTGVAVPTGTRAFLYNNGTDVGDFFNYASSLTLGTALPITSGGTGTTSTTFVNLGTNVTGTLPIANGGTGTSTLTANNVILGNGASALQFVAPGTNGNVLTSNGTTWTSTAATAVNNGTLTMNVSGTGLSGSQTFTANQSGNATFTVTSNATSANTASTIVARDASGNFSAGTITASLSGNATTATTASNVNNGTLTMNVSGTGLSGSQTFTANQSSAATFTVTSNATSANTASTIVARDASGNFSAGTITATLSGNATNITAYTINQSVGTGNNVQHNSLGIGTAASGTAGEIRATNAVTAYYSDDRLKTKLGGIEKALEKLLSLEGFYYEANQTAQDLGYVVKREVGVSAQQVQRVLPEAVTSAPIDDKYLTVWYERLVPLLIEAVKELHAEVQDLKGKINVQ